MKIPDFKKKFLRFWQSDDNKISLLRDVLIALLVVFIILLALWTYTGQWFKAPLVAIESGSMMHPDEPFGRFGTIDAGDMVLLVNVDSRDDIIPRGSDYGGAKAQGANGLQTYGDYGNVIVYRKYGDENEDQIIHRAMCWIEYHENNRTYSVPEYGLYFEISVSIEELGLDAYKPSHSGFITMGDNPSTNPSCDQVGGICSDPIKVEWIKGKAAGELAWVGTLNLFFNDLVSGAFWDDAIEITVYNVPGDSVACLIILIIILVSIPIILDLYDYYRRKNNKEKPLEPLQ